MRFFRLGLFFLACAGSSVAIAQVGSVVTIDADKAMVLNGRKVFPITMSPGPPIKGRTPTGDDALRELRHAGALMFRMVQTTDWNTQVRSNQQAALDWAAEHGMYCMVNLRELSAFADGNSAREAALRSVINQFKNHPALGVWKNSDEAWWGGVSVEDLKRGYDVIKQEDANHPVEQTHAPRGTVADLRPYNVAADILGLDIYPVGIPPGTHSLLPNKEISMVGDWTQFLAQVADGQKQYWMIEQIAWSGVTPPNRTLVFPTFRQSRFMAYQAIINGARGLMFFGGNVAATLNAQDAPLEWNWTFWDEVLKQVVREVGERSPLADALVVPESTLPIAMSGTITPDVEFCVREAPPYLYILACKREGASTNVTFSGLPSWAGSGEVLFESPRTVIAQEGQFSDAFAPFDVHIYRFSQTNRSPAILFGPQSRTNNPGTPAAFYVSAGGTGPLAYQWRRNGVNLLGATSASLVLSSVSMSNAGSYDVVVSGFGSVTSAPAALAVVDYQSIQVPTITSQPQSRENAAGTDASFSVAASGNGPFAWQWRKDGSNLADGGNVRGATSWSLTLSNVSPIDVAGYDVVVTGFTSVTSAVANLTLISSSNQLLLYEPFDYPNIGGPVSSNAPANWTYGGGGANDLSVVIGNLSWPGLAGPTGHSVTNGGVGLGVRRLFSSSVSNGVLYFSALLRINNLGYGAWNGAPSLVGALTATDNTSFRLGVMMRSNTPSGYLVGLQKGGAGATTTFGSTEYHAAETVFLVGKYDFATTPNKVSLWINPAASTFGRSAEPANGFLFATTGPDGFTIDRFNMRQNTGASVPAAIQWDELRIGRAWAAVTPPLNPVLTAIEFGHGAFGFEYIDSANRGFGIHASTNLIDWSPIGSASPIAPGFYRFTDIGATNTPRRFYQLRSP
jgi:hypothetical protein